MGVKFNPPGKGLPIELGDHKYLWRSLFTPIEKDRFVYPPLVSQLMIANKMNLGEPTNIGKATSIANSDSQYDDQWVADQMQEELEELYESGDPWDEDYMEWRKFSIALKKINYRIDIEKPKIVKD
jgi:hypothetical protein